MLGTCINFFLRLASSKGEAKDVLTSRPETEAFALAKLEGMSVNELMTELESMIMPMSLSLPTPGRENSPESSSIVVSLKKEVADLKLKNAELSALRSYYPSLCLSCLVFVHVPFLMCSVLHSRDESSLLGD
jgi:hypothetical protein